MESLKKPESKNVLGTQLQVCGLDPVTGYFRNGFCETDFIDHGSHTVCAVVTEEFLEYTKARGNDLSTPQPAYGFQGLKPGDSWCLCATRWYEAYKAGKAPLVNLEATEASSLKVIPKESLLEKAKK